MNVLSLFSGIGGLDLGLERGGMTVVGQVEIDRFCRHILSRHWPEVPHHDDVATCSRWWASAPRPRVDVVAGGIPCQPFSPAGVRTGTSDPRWGWPWMVNVLRLVRPRYVILENSPGLLNARRAFATILTDLAALGFDAHWGVLPACAVGAPHTRERLFLVAHPHRGHGPPGLGPEPHRAPPIPGLHDRARAWRDRVGRSLAPLGTDHRDLDGSAPRLVAAAGNAVVPKVAEHLAHLLTQTGSPA